AKRQPPYRVQPTTRRPVSRLKLLRVRRQISTQTLAYAAGIPIQLVEKYEEGRVRIPPQHRGRLAYALNVGIEDVPERENLYPVQMPPEAVEGWAWVQAFDEQWTVAVSLVSGQVLQGVIQHLGEAGVQLALADGRSRFVYYHAVAAFGAAEPSAE
ncbi:MAG: helix-turn-helix transcriptional regulator, partial [Chloroflexi bacterium]|nr:helix-turn-helix transcriptional regulator [Chloroflexota bacterium]